MRFSELGAIRFDRDLRSVTAYLGSQAEYGDMREKFQRLQQISTLLNLDEVCFLHPIVAASDQRANCALYRRRTQMSFIVARASFGASVRTMRKP